MVKIYLVKCNGFTYVDSTDEDEFIITNRVMKYLVEEYPVEYELLDEVSINDAEAKEYFWINQYYNKENNLNESKLGNYATEKLLNVVGGLLNRKILKFDHNYNLINVYLSSYDAAEKMQVTSSYIRKLCRGVKKSKQFHFIYYRYVF